MDHETASGLLGDHARGRLDAAQQRDVEAHLATCAECRDVAALLPGVHAQLRQHGNALFDAHPSAEQLGQLALAPDQVDPHERERLEGHARACPTCGHEVALARDAQRTAWTRTAQAWARVAGGPAAAAWLRPAVAFSTLAAVAMLYPAYLGLFRYPHARREAARAMAALDQAQGHAVTTSGPVDLVPWSGGAAILTLTAPTRDAGQAPGDQTAPAVALRHGQPYLPLLLDYEPPVQPQQRLEVSVRRAPDASVVWRTDSTLADLWSRDAAAMVLLIPTNVLAPATYTLELRWGTVTGPGWSSPFRVELALPAPSTSHPASQP